MTEISELIGQTMVSVDMHCDDIELLFTTNEGKVYRLFHEQSCCEEVAIEEIAGDLNNLIGSPILVAEMSTNNAFAKNEGDEEYLWTFYKFATIKGWVDIRWYGESNGYYSVEVDFEEVKPEAPLFVINDPEPEDREYVVSVGKDFVRVLNT